MRVVSVRRAASDITSAIWLNGITRGFHMNWVTQLMNNVNSIVRILLNVRVFAIIYEYHLRAV